MPKRCAYGLCKSDTRYPKSLDGGVEFFPFPKPKTQGEKCRTWITLCGRPHSQLNVDRINKNTYVCSKHFVNGRPTPEDPNPIAALPALTLVLERGHQGACQRSSRKRLRDEDLSVRSKKRRLETLTDVPALQAKESERNSSQSSQDRQSTDKDEDMEVAEICYEVPFPSQTDELAKTELKSEVQPKLEEQARSVDQLKPENQIKMEEQARSVDQLKTEDQLKSAVQIKLEEQARSVDQLKPENQIKLEEQARSVDQLKPENQIKLEEQARSVDQLKPENQIKLEEQARSVDQLKSAVQIKLEEQARSVDQLKTEDQLKPENQIKLKEQARSEDQLKSSVQIKLEEQARSQDQLKTENQIKLEEQARSEDQLKTEDQIKSEVQIKSEDQLNEDFCNGFVAPSLGNEDPRISTSTTKKEIKEEPVETEVQPENRLEISMDSVTTSDKITPNFVQTVNPVTVQVKERLVPNFTGLLRTCFQCGEPVQECTTGSSGSLNQLQWKCSNGHRIFLFSNSNLTQTHTQLS
ncbi:uncharacterized protein [Misgurnus anguillicaudatus]|uniref:uncharacterized protein isoform X3 n=1 Tax=Misgurnus anguillicaudatus TaxID=75329 RepID=UPI003CCEFEC1